MPIQTTRYRSNWELSTARATSVVQFLIEEGQLPPERLVATGYSQYRPKVPNDSPESRARNRRVDLVVLQPEAAAREFGLAGVLGLRQ
jgi:chemotaxis protein MotB